MDARVGLWLNIGSGLWGPTWWILPGVGAGMFKYGELGIVAFCLLSCRSSDFIRSFIYSFIHSCVLAPWNVSLFSGSLCLAISLLVQGFWPLSGEGGRERVREGRGSRSREWDLCCGLTQEMHGGLPLTLTVLGWLGLITKWSFEAILIDELCLPDKCLALWSTRWHLFVTFILQTYIIDVRSCKINNRSLYSKLKLRKCLVSDLFL